MSPAAAASEWVEREILEGQRYDREFLPILLSGDRFFLLAASQYFDARQGQLPGDLEIRQLQRLLDAAAAGAAPGPALDLGAHAGRTSPPARISSTVLLGKLGPLLAEGRVEHADILTTSLLLDTAGRVSNGWLRRADGRNVPFGLLAGIDALWSRFSHGTYGFRAQLALHSSQPPGSPAGGQRDFSALALSLGWKSSPRDTTPRYGEFVKSANQPAGFFPTLRNPQLEGRESWHDLWMETVMAVHIQLRKLGDQES